MDAGSKLSVNATMIGPKPPKHVTRAFLERQAQLRGSEWERNSEGRSGNALRARSASGQPIVEARRDKASCARDGHRRDPDASVRMEGI
jgi:hypothetical protein